MTRPADPPLPDGDIDIDAADLDLDGPEVPETSDPAAYDGDATLGGNGGADGTAGGAG